MAKEKFTQAEVIAALRKTRGLITLAADLLGCDPDTIQRYRKRYPKVDAAIKSYRKRRLDIAEMKLDEKIQAGDLKAITFFLARMGKGRGYTTMTKQEISGPNGKAIEIRATDYRTAIAPLAPRPVGHSDAPGKDQNGVHGEALG